MVDEPQEAGSLREVPASEILAKIKEGKPVEYDHVKIFGDLDASKLALSEKTGKFLVSVPIKIAESRFEGFVAFDNIIFEQLVSFEKILFAKDVFFRDNQFNSAVYFNDCEFKISSDFRKSKYNVSVSFKGSKFNESADFHESMFKMLAYFDDCRFNKDAYFWSSDFNEEAYFRACIFIGEVDFFGCNFCEGSYFVESQFNRSVDFANSEFRDEADFSKSRFSHSVDFIDSHFNSAAFFGRTQFDGDVDFSKSQFDRSAVFYESQFNRIAYFEECRFTGDTLTFKYSKFKNHGSQEDACRRAKNVLAKAGNREEEGYHFYREMEAKRKQKPWYIQYPEFFFVQLVFGYGVHPFRLWAFWFGFVGIFAIIYWLGHGIDARASQLINNATIIDYIWFSIATAVTPGYAGYKPITEFKLVAGLEAIFGTFMWAAFIATFARKYMR